MKTGYGAGLRKGSWEPRLFIDNKENQAVEEEEEHEDEDRKTQTESVAGHEDETASEAGTERRTSYTGTYDSMSYVTGSEVSTCTDRRTASYGSTNARVSASWVSSATERHDDESDAGTETNTDRDENSMVQSTDAGEDEDDSLGQLPPAGSADLVVFGHNDSGLGTDLVSASEKGSALGTSAA